MSFHKKLCQIGREHWIMLNILTLKRLCIITIKCFSSLLQQFFVKIVLFQWIFLPKKYVLNHCLNMVNRQNFFNYRTPTAAVYTISQYTEASKRFTILLQSLYVVILTVSRKLCIFVSFSKLVFPKQIKTEACSINAFAFLGNV